MSNLDNIIEKIGKDAQVEAEKIVDAAKKEQQSIIQRAEEEANQRAQEIIDKAEEEAKALIAKTLESSKLKARDKVLDSKNVVIDRTFDLAYKGLTDMSDKDFMKFINKFLKGVDGEGGVLVVPEKYKDYVRKHSDLKVSDDTVKDGFLLEKEKITYNNRFKNLVYQLKFKLTGEYFEDIFKE
ncbi:MAG: V-type ATP synthase subunit E [Peptoniphilus sp.]|nr:V-type ATP synthase subunit E [Peptoniphilus sp.]